MNENIYCTRFASVEQARAFASIPLGDFDVHEGMLRSIGFDELVDEAEWLASEVAECLLLIRTAATPCIAAWLGESLGNWLYSWLDHLSTQASMQREAHLLLRDPHE